ncbi:MAG: hypothetical protein WA985_06505 [Erythrobacter sp.]|uniref:hypothetical protein n=1 Tax=Erythrobacter sp. TaxID=1042 RepID=UPI003C743047
MSTYTDAERERAQRRFFWLQAMRLGALAAVLAGIAITQDVLGAPYWLGLVLALGGVFAFFFAPPLLARRFKADDAKLPDRLEP